MSIKPGSKVLLPSSITFAVLGILFGLMAVMRPSSITIVAGLIIFPERTLSIRSALITVICADAVMANCMLSNKKAILIVLDSVGIGEAPDAAEYGDAGSATLPNIGNAVGGLELPTLQKLGLGNIPQQIVGKVDA